MNMLTETIKKYTRIGAYVLVALLVSVTSCDTKDSVAPAELVAFIKFYGGLNDQEGVSVAEKEEGGYILFGQTNSFGNGGYDLFAIGTDELGNEIWRETYGGSGDDFAGSMIIDPVDGSAILVGTKENSDSDVFLLKVNSNDGSVIWQNDTIGFRGFDEVGNTLTMTEGGGIIVAGGTSNFANQSGLRVQDIYSAKLNSSGELEWERRDGFGDDVGTDIISFSENDQETFVVFGTTREPLPDIIGGTNYLLVKFQNEEEVIRQAPLGETNDQTSGKFLRTSDGGFILSGTTNLPDANGGSEEIYLIRTDKDFGVLAESKIGGSARESGFGIHALNDGSFLLSGSTNSYGTGQSDIFLVNLDASLRPFSDWEAAPRTFGGSGNDFGAQAIQTRDDGFAIIGNSTFGNNTNRMISLVKTNSVGRIEE